MIVLNGRSPGDFLTQFTYCKHWDGSVIDLAWCNLEILNFITDFWVLQDICISDHFRIQIFLNDNTKNRTPPNNMTPYLRLIWDPSKSLHYTLKSEALYSANMATENIVKSNDAIRENIVKASENLSMTEINKSKNNNNEAVVRETWFDKQCLDLENQLKNTLNSCIQNVFRIEKYRTQYR